MMCHCEERSDVAIPRIEGDCTPRAFPRFARGTTPVSAPARNDSRQPPIELVSAIEILDPMVLASRVREAGGSETVPPAIPDAIRELFDEPLVVAGGTRQLFVTLGQFSIVRLERQAQLVVPVLDYAVPSRECCDAPGAGSEDPCEMFSRIPFPTQQFTPRSCSDTETDTPPYQTC